MAGGLRPAEFYLRCYDADVLREALEHPTPALEREAGGGVYSRKEVCRLLKIDSRQLKRWERQRLIPGLAQYKFTDLLKLKRLAKLRAEHAHPRLVRTAMRALDEYLKKTPQSSDDVQIYKEGRRVCIQIGKQRMEPGSGQMLFDFAEEEISKLLHLPGAKNAVKMASQLRDKLEADRWFEHALELEQSGAPYEEVIEAYQKTVELDPRSAGAYVNLGTVFFNGHAWSDAEENYLRALEIDPDYALAHFNLGNLYDEQDDLANAEKHYLDALRLHPNYADAHYNTALLYQGTRDFMRAVWHWRAYLKLDSSSTWSQIARRELDKMEALAIHPGNRATQGPAAKMQLVPKSTKGNI